MNPFTCPECGRLFSKGHDLRTNQVGPMQPPVGSIGICDACGTTLILERGNILRVIVDGDINHLSTEALLHLSMIKMAVEGRMAQRN